MTEPLTSKDVADDASCRFCGASSDDSTLIQVSTEKVPHGYVVECDKCYASGPIKETEDEACAAWNAGQPHEPKQQILT